MDDPNPRQPIFSLQSKMLLIGLVIGYLLAAFGEQVRYSKGTLFGAAIGALIGGFIGGAISSRKRP